MRDARTRGIIQQIAEEECNLPEHLGVDVPGAVKHCFFCNSFTTSESVVRCLLCRRPLVTFRFVAAETSENIHRERDQDDVEFIVTAEGRLAVRARRRPDALAVFSEASRRIAAQAADTEDSYV